MRTGNRVVYAITDEYALVHNHGSDNLYLEWREKGKPVRRSTGHTSLEPAKRRARELIIEHATIRDADPNDVPLLAIIERYYVRHGKALASADTAKRALALFKEFFSASETVADFIVTRQMAFLGWLKERGLTEAYARRILGVGKAALNHAWHNNELKQVPFVRLPPIGSRYPHWAKFDQLVALLNTPMPDHLFTYCMIRLNTGSRGDAARDLQPFQVDFHAGLIDLNPAGRVQTKKFRPVVPLTDFLRAYLEQLPADDLYVHWNGKKVASIRTTWRALRTDAKLPAYFNAKILRHTVGTELRRRGVPGWDVAGQLGHKKGESSPTTENYAKFDPEFLAVAKAAFDAWMVELAAKVPRMQAVLSGPIDATAMQRAGTKANGGTPKSPAVAVLRVVGGEGFEPPTPTMSRLRNNN